MNHSGRLSRQKRARAPRLATTTRAIRSALAVSATMLALSGSGAALAGTCAVTALNTVSCNGVFTDTVNNSVPVIDLVPDLTLVLGDSAATTVTPGFGAPGVDASWGGDVGVISYADITTNGADGIHEYGSETATLENHGYIETYVSVGGAQAVQIGAYGDVSVVNDGGIDAYSFNGYSVQALAAYSVTGDVSVDNQAGGSISSFGRGDSVAVYVDAYGSATIGNEGHIEAFGYGTANGVLATAGDTLELDNSGTIAAYSGYGNAYGVDLDSTYGTASFNNGVDGVVTATSYYGIGIGVQVAGYDAVADNDGSISGVGYSYGIGIVVESYYGDASLDNSGEISGYGNRGFGAEVASYLGNASLVNSGEITGSGLVAGGVFINSVNGVASLTNSGSIVADGDYSATGATMLGEVAYIENEGAISATAYFGTAIGLAVFAGQSSTLNEGEISAYSYYGQAVGIRAVTNAAEASTAISNSGTIDVESVNATAEGIYAHSYYGSIDVDNSGTVQVLSDYGSGFGVFVISGAGEIHIDNSGQIQVTGGTFGTGVDALGGLDVDISIDNSGSVYADAGTNNANGIFASTLGAGEVYALNTGEVVAISDGAFASGISLRSVDGGIELINSGDIDAEAGALGSAGIRLRATGSGDISVDNTGNIVATSAASEAFGIYAGAFDGGDIDAANAGSIQATGETYGIGIEATGLGGVYVSNTGHIAAYAHGKAIGIDALSTYGDISVDNSGDIYAYSPDGEATGIFGYGFSGNIYVSNSGSIEAYSYGEAKGIDILSYGAGIISVSSSGSIDVASSAAQAEGINAVGHGAGNVYVDNSGSINVYAYGVSSGIYAYSALASVYVYNSGDIYASSYFDYATGIDALSPTGNAYVNSSGGSVAAYTVYGVAIGINASAATGDATVINGSDVTATGAIAVGINADAPTGTAYVYNYGSVGAYSYYDGATAIGINAHGVYADVNQSGSVYAYAGGYDFASASGVRVYGDVSANFYSGGGSTDAVANAYYGAIAEGAVLIAPSVSFYNAGDISASASASGEYGSAVAIGVRAIGDYVDFYNAGSIYAYASAYSGQAVGGLIDSTNSVIAYNTGDISAVGAGPYVNAVGLDVYSNLGDSTLFNYGSISASSDYWAIGVELDTDSYGYIYNGGTIEASGGYYSIAIYSTGLSPDTIVNYGTITGSIWTGEGDDYLLNAAGGVWNAIETSYFGNGDDVIVNHGLIAMDDATIDLGYHAVYGNGFYNFGTVSANGTNYINMGSGTYTLVPSLNPNPFYNYGAITFQDGAADDMLTITGDFAGDGDINVDVSGLDGVSDILYIDGSVVDGTVGTINVDLLDLPTSIETTVPMLYVSGDSVASNFVLGNVNWDAPDSFVSLDFSLIADIDATNVDPDVFSLGIEVTGLSDAGTITAAVPGVVQSLMNTQVGTWRQRMGVIDSFSDGAVSLWARVFYDRGSFSPEHTFANFGPGGNFEYDEFNSGAEAGVDFAVTDEFSLGLLLSKSRGKASLEDPGVGTAKVEADTWGVYGTWISPNGFYLDASYRWMSFDTTLESSFGVLEGDGDAEAFNIEVGYAWTLAGGLKIEPQFQYTRTNVDNLTVFQTASGMTFTNDGGDSSRGRLGVSIRKSFGDADDSWMWTPYATLSAVREFDGENAFAVNNTFFGTTTVEGTSALLELGFTARHENWAIYGGLNWQDGGAVDSFFGGQLGVRYTFGGAAPAPAPVAPPPAKTCADLDDDGDGVNNCDDKCLGTAAGTAVGPDGCPVPAPEPEPAPEPKPFRG